MCVDPPVNSFCSMVGKARFQGMPKLLSRALLLLLLGPLWGELGHGSNVFLGANIGPMFVHGEGSNETSGLNETEGSSTSLRFDRTSTAQVGLSGFSQVILMKIAKEAGKIVREEMTDLWKDKFENMAISEKVYELLDKGEALKDDIEEGLEFVRDVLLNYTDDIVDEIQDLYDENVKGVLKKLTSLCEEGSTRKLDLADEEDDEEPEWLVSEDCLQRLWSNTTLQNEFVRGSSAPARWIFEDGDNSFQHSRNLLGDLLGQDDEGNFLSITAGLRLAYVPRIRSTNYGGFIDMELGPAFSAGVQMPSMKGIIATKFTAGIGIGLDLSCPLGYYKDSFGENKSGKCRVCPEVSFEYCRTTYKAQINWFSHSILASPKGFCLSCWIC